MKKHIVFLLLLAIVAISFSQDTLFVGDRDPKYYYGGKTNYWDWWFLNVRSSEHNEWGDSITFRLVGWTRHGKSEFAKAVHVDRPIKVIGVALAAETDINYPVAITTPLPDYAILYHPDDTNMVKIASARWDTASPSWYIPVDMDVWRRSYWANRRAIGYWSWESNYKPVYEAYFEEPVIVTDSCYIGLTNNGYYRFSKGIFTVPTPWGDMEVDSVYWAGPRRAYYANVMMYDTAVVLCKPPYWRERFHIVDQYNGVGNLPIPPEDTFWHYQPYANNVLEGHPERSATAGGIFIHVFPIIDTGWNSDVLEPFTDSCPAPNNFRVVDVFDGNATLYCESDVTEWQVSVGHGISTPEMGSLHHFNSQFATISDLDTAQWYVAWVRAVCDSGSYSAWSDSLLFYVPADTTHQHESVVTAEDYYTSLVPNPASDRVLIASPFRIREIEIYTLSGKRVLLQAGKGGDNEVDISSLPSGTYVVRVKTNRGFAVKKLVVR